MREKFVSSQPHFRRGEYDMKQTSERNKKREDGAFELNFGTQWHTAGPVSCSSVPTACFLHLFTSVSPTDERHQQGHHRKHLVQIQD